MMMCQQMETGTMSASEQPVPPLGPLEEEPVLLTSEPPRHPLGILTVLSAKEWSSLGFRNARGRCKGASFREVCFSNARKVKTSKG